MMDTTGESSKISAVGRRAYGSENFQLDLDGLAVGFLNSLEGGAIAAEVIQERLGTHHYVGKHLGPIRYEEVTVTTDLALDRSFYAWIADTWSGKFARRDVTLYRIDSNNHILGLSEFYNALITEVTIPKMDAASKDPAFLTVKFAPEYIRYKKDSGGKLKGSPSKKGQKKWLPSNFKLTIGDLDCSKVNKVDAFTVKQVTQTAGVGELRDYQMEPTSLEYPNLTIYLAEAAAQTWRDWHEDFVIKGNNGAAQEKSGSLAFYSPNMQDVLGQINFSGVGIFKLSPPGYQAGVDQIRRLKAELYVESMEFVFGSP